MTTVSYHLSSRPLEFLTMIQRVVSDFSSFSRCLEICLEFSVPLTEFVARPTKYPICPIFILLEVMPRVSTALHLLVA